MMCHYLGIPILGSRTNNAYINRLICAVISLFLERGSINRNQTLSQASSDDRLSGWSLDDACAEAAERVSVNGPVHHPDPLGGWTVSDACAEAAERVRANSNRKS